MTTATATAKIITATASNKINANQLKEAFMAPIFSAVQSTGTFLYNSTIKTIPTIYLYGFCGVVVLWGILWFWYNFYR